MSAVTSAPLSWTLLSVCLLFVSADQEKIKSGQDVTLTCKSPNNNVILAVQWSRADLGDEYVLLYRDEQFDPSKQHPSFKNRVDLQDRQMKDGDVSLILKNVTTDDTGTYECRVYTKGANQNGAEEMLLCNITLSVIDPPGQTGPSVGLIVGLSLLAAAVVGGVAAGGAILWYKSHKEKSPPFERLQSETSQTT